MQAAISKTRAFLPSPDTGTFIQLIRIPCPVLSGALLAYVAGRSKALVKLAWPRHREESESSHHVALSLPHQPHVCRSPAHPHPPAPCPLVCHICGSSSSPNTGLALPVNHSLCLLCLPWGVPFCQEVTPCPFPYGALGPFAEEQSLLFSFQSKRSCVLCSGLNL